MSRLNMENSELYDPVIRKGFKLASVTLTLGGNLTMDRDFPPIVNLDPNGARTVFLPPEEEGLTFFFNNWAGGAEDITVRDDGDATTIGTISQNESAVAFCAGGVWKLLVGAST